MKISDNQIRKCSFLLFLFSFLLIIIFDFYYVVPLHDLEKLSIKDLNKNIRTNGIIVGQLQLSETLFLSIEKNKSSIEVIGFFANEKFEVGNSVEVTGKISMSNKKLQIIANEIRVIPYTS